MNTLNLLEKLEILKGRKTNNYTKRGIEFYEYLFSKKSNKLFYEPIEPSKNKNHLLEDLYSIYKTEPFFISFLINDNNNEILTTDNEDCGILIDEFKKNVEMIDKNAYEINDIPYHYTKINIFNKVFILKIKPFVILRSNLKKDETSSIFLNKNNMYLLTTDSYTIIYQYRIIINYFL